MDITKNENVRYRVELSEDEWKLIRGALGRGAVMDSGVIQERRDQWRALWNKMIDET